MAGTAIDGIAGMQVNNRGAGFGSTDGSVGNFLRGDRQMRRHRRRMDGTGDGAGDDDRTIFGHDDSPTFILMKKIPGAACVFFLG
jgi:hypothetical protein